MSNIVATNCPRCGKVLEAKFCEGPGASCETVTCDCGRRIQFSLVVPSEPPLFRPSRPWGWVVGTAITLLLWAGLIVSVVAVAQIF